MKKLLLVLFFCFSVLLVWSQEKSYYLGLSDRIMYNSYGGPFDITDSLVLEATQVSTNNNFGFEFQYKSKINNRSSIVYRSRLLFGLRNDFATIFYKLRTPKFRRSSYIGYSVRQVLLTSGAQYQRHLYGPLSLKLGLESRFHPMIENRGRYDDELLDILEGEEYEDVMKPVFYEYFNSIRRFSLSYCMGLTIALSEKINLGLEYETNFTNLVSDITIDGRNYKIRKRNETLNIAVLIKFKNKKPSGS